MDIYFLYILFEFGFFYAKKEEHHEIKSQGTGKTDASYGR